MSNTKELWKFTDSFPGPTVSQALGAAKMLPDLNRLIVLRIRLKPLPYLPIYLHTHTHTHTHKRTGTHVCVCVYVILIRKIKQGRLHRKGGKLMEL